MGFSGVPYKGGQYIFEERFRVFYKFISYVKKYFNRVRDDIVLKPPKTKFLYYFLTLEHKSNDLNA